MSTFSIALVLDHPDAISIGKALHNLIPVTLGNMVGGTAFMALLYYYLGGPNSDDEDEFQEDDEDYSYMNKK